MCVGCFRSKLCELLKVIKLKTSVRKNKFGKLNSEHHKLNEYIPTKSIADFRECTHTDTFHF